MLIQYNCLLRVNNFQNYNQTCICTRKLFQKCIEPKVIRELEKNTNILCSIAWWYMLYQMKVR